MYTCTCIILSKRSEFAKHIRKLCLLIPHGKLSAREVVRSGICYQLLVWMLRTSWTLSYYSDYSSFFLLWSDYSSAHAFYSDYSIADAFYFDYSSAEAFYVLYENVFLAIGHTPSCTRTPPHVGLVLPATIGQKEEWVRGLPSSTHAVAAQIRRRQNESIGGCRWRGSSRPRLVMAGGGYICRRGRFVEQQHFSAEVEAQQQRSRPIEQPSTS
jgi:hypothetical protein